MDFIGVISGIFEKWYVKYYDDHNAGVMYGYRLSLLSLLQTLSLTLLLTFYTESQL